MIQKMKNFCAGLVLTLMIPAFFGGQFDVPSKVRGISLLNITAAHYNKEEDKICMDDAIAILP